MRRDRRVIESRFRFEAKGEDRDIYYALRMKSTQLYRRGV